MAARMVSGVCQSEHITPVLEDLHWLPVSQQVVFKTALMVWNLEVCSWCHSSLSQRPLRTRYCHLRSSASAICSDWHFTGSTCPDSNWTTSFAVNGPATWNHLPPALRSPDLSESAFKWALKMHLFSTTRRHGDVLMILVPDVNIQIY